MHAPESYNNLVRPDIRDADTFPYLVEKMKITSRNQKSFKILDFGSGDGKLSSMYMFPLVEETESELVCLDSSIKMLEFAKSNFPHPRVKYILGDLLTDQLFFQEGEFDYIFSFYALHYVKDYRKAFKKFHRLLKPGGMFGFVTVVKHRELTLHKYLGTDPKWSKYTQGYESFVPDWIDSGANPDDCIRDAAEGAGFVVRGLVHLERGANYEKMTQCSAFHRSIYPFIGAIPDEMHADLDKAILSHICTGTNLPDNEETHNQPFRNEYEIIMSVVQKQ